MQSTMRNPVNPRAAREEYGVVLAGAPLTVDTAATRSLREQMRRKRQWSEVPVYSWGDKLAAE